jgi:predicted RNase H-like nuclease (RuvC/YqgF family)
MTVESFECEKVRYTARNQDTSARQLVIEHPRRAGWRLITGAAAPAESTTSAHRFQVPVGPAATAALVVAAYRPVQSAVRVVSMSEEQLQVFIRQGALDEKTRAALESLIAGRRGIAQLDTQISANQQEVDRIDTDQQRLRENMKSLKGSAEEKQLVQRYVSQLNDQENRLGTLRSERAALDRQRQERELALVTQIDALSLESGAAATPCR